MTDLTREEMDAILLEHEIAELEYDIDRTMATLVPNPHYEIATLGLAVDGWDAIYRTYQRLIRQGGEERNIQAVARVIGEARNTLMREAHVSFDDDAGNRVTGLYMVVMEFDPVHKKILGERMYTDTVFGAFLARTLGEDFATLPGVSRISANMPVIDRHDAFDAAAAQGLTINNPRVAQ